MDFKTALTAMATAQPDAPVSLILDLALAVENALPPNLDDARAFGQWAARQPTVAAELGTNGLIPSVKALRALTHCSLRQAKDAIEAI